MPVAVDPAEERDAWRALWRFLTGDALMIALCSVAVAGLIATVILPQQPSAGTSDPVAYSRWEVEAKRREGALYEVLNGLGFNNVAQAAWWRIALAALIPVAGLRLADRLVRLADARRSGREGALRDERRARVTSAAPSLDDLAERLRARRYRVVRPEEEVLVADRAPWAELASAGLHMGVMLTAAGLLLNLIAGWEAPSKLVVAGAATPLREGRAVTLADSDDDPGRVTAVVQPDDASVVLGEGERASIAGLDIALRQIMPGYRLSATTRDARPLLIRGSNFVSPTAELLVTLSADEPERYVAVPEARLALALAAADATDRPVRLVAFALPSGKVITETTVQPTLFIGDVEFRFKPAQSAMVDVRHAPGEALWQLGLVIGLLGAVASLIYPMRRLLIRRQGEWTEFYVSGRNGRREVAWLIEPPSQASPS